MTREWYAYGDKRYEEYAEKARKLFRKTRLTLPFDEINALTARKAANRLYKRLDEALRAVLLDVARRAYRETGPGEDPPDEDWLEAYLALYGPVTKYVFTHEEERKRARFFESVAADAASGNRLGLELDFKTAQSLWLKQCAQAVIDVEDAAALKGYRDAGVKRVTWRAELDGRECAVCRKRHRKIYPIAEVPGKPHYGCRCYLLAVPTEREDAVD